MEYHTKAPFASRTIALFIDALTVKLLTMLFLPSLASSITVPLLHRGFFGSGASGLVLIEQFHLGIQFLIAWTYFSLADGILSDNTIGKKVTSLSVVSEHGGPLEWDVCILRGFAKVLPYYCLIYWMIFGTDAAIHRAARLHLTIAGASLFSLVAVVASLVMPLFNQRGQSLHDWFARSVVICC